MTAGGEQSRLETIKEHIVCSAKLPDFEKTELRYQLDQLVEETKREAAKTKWKFANPGAVGLAGFGVAAFLLQLHTLDVVQFRPVLWVGMFCGGLTQLCAGLMEFVTGNTFGFCAFSTYGGFWMALTCMEFFDPAKTIFPVSERDKGFFLMAFVIFTLILFIGSLRESTALAFVFGTLLLGLIILMTGHFAEKKWVMKLGASVMLVNVAAAFYVLAHIIFLETYKYDMFPVGRPVNEWRLFQTDASRVPEVEAEVILTHRTNC